MHMMVWLQLHTYVMNRVFEIIIVTSDFMPTAIVHFVYIKMEQISCETSIVLFMVTMWPLSMLAVYYCGLHNHSLIVLGL